MTTSTPPPTPFDPGDGIDPANYDCRRLFPAGVTAFYTPGGGRISEVPSAQARRWLRVSAFTTAAVGALSKFWLRFLNRAQIVDRDNLSLALHDRRRGAPLITVANHQSCMDEPLLWGMLDWRELSDNHLMRWVLSAHNICYSNRLYAAFFSYGKSIPVVRGAGIRQQGMKFCVDRLAGGQWAHIYPEGKVNTNPRDTALLPLRWGVGHLVLECFKRVPTEEESPVVLPIYHLGMDDLLPNTKPYFPRVAKRVTVCIGEPIPVKDLLVRLDAEGRSDDEKRKAVTELVAKGLLRLRIQAEIQHAKFTFTGDGGKKRGYF